jgi:hypothetical protein
MPLKSLHKNTNNKDKHRYYPCLKEGKYIGVRSYYNYHINLYLWKDEFYEVWYFREENRIEKIEKLTDEKRLNLYISSANNLDKINVEK